MIKINLLPEDQRAPGTGGPASTQFLVILVSAFLVIIALGFYLFTHFHLLATATDNLAKKKSERESLKKYEKEHDELQQHILFFKKHQQAAESCLALRIPFSRKIHEFATLIVGPLNQPVWLSSLNISSVKVATKKGSQAPAPQFRWQGPVTCAADRLEIATAFHRSVYNSDFFKDFIQINIPKYSKTTFANYRQKIAWNFDLEMIMQMRSADVANKSDDQKDQKK